MPSDIYVKNIRIYFAVLFHVFFNVFIFRRVLMGTHTLVQNGDSVDQSFAWLTKVFRATREGQIVLWDFSTSSGVSFIGELQTSPLYPPAWLIGLLFPAGTLQAFDTFLILHFAVAAWGMTWLALRLGLGLTGSLVASIVFTYGSALTLRAIGQPNLFAGLVWMPWLCLAVAIALRAGGGSHSIAASVGAAVALSLSFLAGHVHSTILSLIACAFLLPAMNGAWRPDQSEPRFLQFDRDALPRAFLLLCLAAVITIGLCAPQIIATKEYLDLSYKWYGEGFTRAPHVPPLSVFTQASVKIIGLMTFWTGNNLDTIDGATFYITKIGFLLSIYILIYSFLKNFRNKIVIICCVFMMLFSITFAFSSVTPIAWIYANIPLVNLIRSPARALFLFGFAGAILAGAGADALLRGALRTAERLAWSPLVRFQAATVLGAFFVAAVSYEAALYSPRRMQAEIANPNTAAQTFLNNPVVQKLEELTKSSGGIYRYHAPRELVPPNVGNAIPVLSSHGYRSTRTIAYHEYFDFNPLSDRLDALSVRWWVSIKPIEGLPILSEINGKYIQERSSALPVLWLALADGSRRAAPIKEATWSSNAVEFKLEHPVSGRFVFAQTIYPGWRVELDDIPTMLSTHEGVLQAVDAVGRVQKLKFIYDPTWWKTSIIISIMTVMFIFMLVLIQMQKILNSSKN